MEDILNGNPFHWEQGKSFVVSLWRWHEHVNRSASEDAILFSMNGAPVWKPFGLFREEGQGTSRIGM